jgi:formate transporter FocA
MATNNTMQIDALLPAEVARKAEDVGVVKANQTTIKLLVLGVLAGAFIGLGAVFATTVTAGGELGWGASRLLGGLVFSLGLILVVVAGAELFTGNNLIVMAFASGRVSLGKLLRCWGIVYVGNFVGAIATATLVFFAEHHMQGGGTIGRRALAIASHKTSLAPVAAVALGILCNVLVCLAVWLCLSARSVADKILAILFPITAFVAAGFEHCIANMYFIPEGLLIKDAAPASFWETTGLSPDAYPDLSWGSFLVSNLLPVTIGNIIGGTVLVGLVYWFVYLRPTQGRQ